MSVDGEKLMLMCAFIDLIISKFAGFPQFVRQLRISESDTSSSGKHQQGYS